MPRRAERDEGDAGRGRERGPEGERRKARGFGFRDDDGEEGRRMKKRSESRVSRPVARQEPFPIDVIDTLFCPFFHPLRVSSYRLGLRITTRDADRSVARALRVATYRTGNRRWPTTDGGYSGRIDDVVSRLCRRLSFPGCTATISISADKSLQLIFLSQRGNAE